MNSPSASRQIAGQLLTTSCVIQDTLGGISFQQKNNCRVILTTPNQVTYQLPGNDLGALHMQIKHTKSGLYDVAFMAKHALLAEYKNNRLSDLLPLFKSVTGIRPTQ